VGHVDRVVTAKRSRGQTSLVRAKEVGVFRADEDRERIEGRKVHLLGLELGSDEVVKIIDIARRVTTPLLSEDALLHFGGVIAP